MTGTEPRTGVAVHVVQRLGEPSQVWLNDLIASPSRYRGVAVCEVDLRAEQADPPALAVLRPQLPIVPYRLQHKLSVFAGRPLNPWKRALRSSAIPAHDVMHAHFGHIGWRCADAGVDRLVTTFYGFDMSALPRRRIWRRAYGLLFERGAAFLAEGPAMRAALIELGSPPTRTYLQPLVADLDERPCPPDPDAAPLIVMAGRFVEKKGFAEGVRAFSRAAERHTDARLILIGSGPEEQSIGEAIARSPAADRIEVHAFMDRSDYRALLRRATILLQPSRTASDGDSEGGAPTTLLDAQALGKVIVASRHADIPFVVDERAAYLYEEFDVDGLAQCLQQALEERDDWRRRGVAGRQHVERQHSRQAVAFALERVYDSVASRS